MDQPQRFEEMEVGRQGEKNPVLRYERADGDVARIWLPTTGASHIRHPTDLPPVGAGAPARFFRGLDDRESWPSSSALIGGKGRPPSGRGSATYSKSGSSFQGPRTSSSCERLNTSLTVSSGGMFPKYGSSNLPIASSAFMNMLAWVISRVRRWCNVFLVPSSSQALISDS